LENLLHNVGKESLQALERVSAGQREKFDLIFGVLTELRNRQKQIEDTLDGLKRQGGGNAYYANGHAASSASSGGQAQHQPYSAVSHGVAPHGQASSGYGSAAGGSCGGRVPQENGVAEGRGLGSPSIGDTANDHVQWQPRRPPAAAAAAPSAQPWDKIRTWRVINVEPAGSRKLAVVKTQDQPYPPNGSRAPDEEAVAAWLQSGDIVKQVGHSKKMRGFMCMPVRVVLDEAGLPIADEELAQATDDSASNHVEGWVTRRYAAPKDGGRSDVMWFEEVGREHTDERPRRHKS
jgi:hypothetical protein